MPAQMVMQPLTQVDTTAQYPLGKLAEDASGNTYQYAKGVASTVAGSAAVLNADGTTTLTGVASIGPVGFAAAAIGANQYGWYLRNGVGVGNAAGAVAANARLQTTATAGAVDDTATANLTIVGAYAAAAAGGAGAMQVRASWPSAYGIAL
jgi:hypothetical protein